MLALGVSLLKSAMHLCTGFVQQPTLRGAGLCTYWATPYPGSAP
jgi:hypothetical protein